MPDLAISKETIDEAIDRAHAAVMDLEVSVQKIGVNLIDKLTVAAHAWIADFLKDENNIIAALDGWTLNLSATIRLTKPK